MEVGDLPVGVSRLIDLGGMDVAEFAMDEGVESGLGFAPQQS